MNPEFDIEDVVYHKTDVDQTPHMVVGLVVRGNKKEFTYIIRMKHLEMEVYGCEITKEKVISF